MGRRLRTQTRFDLALGDVCGEVALREAIVDYLRISRGIDCQPEQVFITHGYAASIALILHALAKPGNGMWIEDPGFPLIRPIVTAMMWKFCLCRLMTMDWISQAEYKIILMRVLP